jgi:hypothetical protein
MSEPAHDVAVDGEEDIVGHAEPSLTAPRQVVDRPGRPSRRMLAGQRRAALDGRGRLRELDREARRLHPAFGRMVIFDEGAVVLDLRILDEIGIAIDRAAPDIGARNSSSHSALVAVFSFSRVREDLVAMRPAVGLVVHRRRSGSPISFAQIASFGEGHRDDVAVAVANTP